MNIQNISGKSISTKPTFKNEWNVYISYEQTKIFVK